MNNVRKRVKRCIDCMVSFSGLVLGAPFLLLVAAAVRITMGPPVFFRQQRPGLMGAPFYLVKFRTMRHPRPGENSAESDRLRLTRLGRFLRSTSLDELPTLWNVLSKAI
jgi:sugar transferase EpsL